MASIAGASRGGRGAAIALLLLAACASPSPPATGRAWPEAEALFRSEPRWMGGDGILSIPLGPDRVLWLFGDSFIALTPAHRRTESRLVRNSVALQSGGDLLAGAMEFAWGEAEDGSPASFFPEMGERWFWPGHGMRLEEGPLLVFLYGIIATPGEGLGFASRGYVLALIDDPDAPLSSWEPRIFDLPLSRFDAVPATAVIRDGDHLIGLAIRQVGAHAGALVRYPVASLLSGDASGAEWWMGSGRGWVPEAEVGPGGPAFVIDDAGSECSLHWDARTSSFLHVATYGFGATEIGLRSAPALTGPWTPPAVVYRPPESLSPRPFVYAAKAHVEQSGPAPSDLVLTYATNSFEFGDLFTPEGAQQLYWPRVVVIPVGPP